MGYDDDSQAKTVYNGKVEKLLKKAGGMLWGTGVRRKLTRTTLWIMTF